MILESRGGWTEAVVYLLVVRGAFTMTLYKYLGRYAHNDAERFIYGHALADKARHVTYALDHLKYATAHADDVLQVVRTLIAIGEGGLTRDLRDPVLAEALAVIFARGVDKAAGRGMAVYGDMMRDYVGTYLGYCQWLGVPRDPARLPPPLNEYANPPDAGRHETRRPTGRRVSPQPKPSPNSFGNAAGAANPKNSGV